MKLKEFSLSSIGQNNRIPRIRINGKSGSVTFNNPAVRRLNLNSGDGITFHQDEDQMTDWYIKPEKKEGSFTVKRFTNANGFSCTNLAREMLRTMVGVSEMSKSHSFIVSGKPYEGYYAIIAKTKK